MAYARMGENSDVYVYHDGQTYVCCGCSLKNGDSVRIPTAQGMLTHLTGHSQKEEKIPLHCIERLNRDVERVSKMTYRITYLSHVITISSARTAQAACRLAFRYWISNKVITKQPKTNIDWPSTFENTTVEVLS